MNNYHSLVLDQKESTKHGEHSFPVQKYITTLSADCPVVTTHWHEEAELADVCNFSDYHFMRFFKKHMNMTCIEYINNLRLEKSVELFKQGNTSIVDVSLSVGFNNLSYFYRAFNKKYHMTPLSYIKLTPS